MDQTNTSETEKLAGRINRSLGCLGWCAWTLFCYIVMCFIFGFEFANFISGLIILITGCIAVFYWVKSKVIIK